MAKRIKYNEGNVFLIPLQSHGYGVGVIARISTPRKWGCIVGYFFDKYYDEPPIPFNCASLIPSEAKAFFRFSHLKIYHGEWPIVGSIPDFKRSDWIMPHYIRKNYSHNFADRIIYNEDNPLEEIE